MNTFLTRLTRLLSRPAANAPFGSQEQDIEQALARAHDWLDREAAEETRRQALANPIRARHAPEAERSSKAGFAYSRAA